MPASAYVDRNEQQREYSDIAHVRTGPPHRASPNPAQQQRSGKTGELADRIQIANQLKITPPVLNLGSRPATPVQARQTLPQDNGDLRGRPIFKQVLDGPSYVMNNTLTRGSLGLRSSTTPRVYAARPLGIPNTKGKTISTKLKKKHSCKDGCTQTI